MGRRSLTLLVAVAALSFAAMLAALVLIARTDSAAAPVGDGPYRGSEAPPGLALPAFALRDHEGGQVSADGLRGRALAVTFLDTQCVAACPVIAAHVARAFELLKPDERASAAAVAITVDPAGDTPERVAAFLARHRAADSLRYVTGTESELRPVWRAFGVVASMDTGSHDLHSAPVRIYDAAGNWVATQHAGADLSPENLAHDLRLAAGASG
jgi:protein SCO1